MHWYTWAAIILVAYVAIAPIALSILKVGGDADNRSIEPDEHEGGIPL